MPHHLPLGKLPAQPARPHLRLSAISSVSRLPAPPPVVDYYTAVPDWGMLGNAQFGCCVESGIGHAVEQTSVYAAGAEVRVTDEQTLAEYSAITGFDRNDPNTDRGTYMQDAMSYWRKRGMFGGHRVAAYATVSLTDWNEIGNAVDMFGSVLVGFNFPASAMSQFNDEQPWTVVPGSPVEGGHCVLLVGYDERWLYVVTWGRVQRMARDFWAKFVDEAWVAVTPETITSQGANAYAAILNLEALGAAFAELTGEPSPFQPAPAPSPVPMADVVALAARLRHWAVDERHHGDNKHAADTLRQFMRDYGVW